VGHDAAIAHLKDLGVTTVELLPVHQNVPEAFLIQRGLTNYWGYNTIGFFAPHNGYSAAVRAGQPGGQVAEFKAMIDALHRAGLEVILDVVFNHTAEAGPDGPTLCFRGIDNLAYYRVDPGNPGLYSSRSAAGRTEARPSSRVTNSVTSSVASPHWFSWSRPRFTKQRSRLDRSRAQASKPIGRGNWRHTVVVTPPPRLTFDG
jgi:pullulanase/glycogen debranching enzyme